MRRTSAIVVLGLLLMTLAARHSSGFSDATFTSASANAGTVASLRLRGYTKPCYNVLEFEGDQVKITRKYPFGGGSVIAHFSLSTGEQFHRELEPPVQQRTTVSGAQLGE